MKIAVTVIGIVLLVMFVLLLAGSSGMMGLGGYVMGRGMMDGYGGYGGMMGGYGFNPLAGILTIVFWFLIIGGVSAVIVWLVHGEGPVRLFTGVRESPVDILKTRYAKGDITKEQFETMKRDLGA